MSKTEVENLITLSTSFLYKYKYFIGRRSGEIYWPHNWSRERSRVGVEVVTMGDENYLRIRYTQTSRRTGEKRDFDYKVNLLTTPCFFGSIRFWFECPLSKNGVPCGRRVGVLYKDGDYFGCRHCHNLTYESRNLSGIFRLFGRPINDDDLASIRYSIKRTHYKGKPTKRYQRYLKLSKQSEESHYRVFKLVDDKSKGSNNTKIN